MAEIEGSYTVSELLLAREDFQAACRSRDVGKVFRLLQQWDGVSQDKIAAPIEGFTQSRVSRLIRNLDRVQTIDVIEHISDGIHIPGSFFGLIPRHWEEQDQHRTLTAVPAHAAAVGAGVSAQTSSLLPPGPSPSGLWATGELVDTRLEAFLDIEPDGSVTVSCEHHVENRGDTPVTALVRQFWFKHVTNALKVTALPSSDRNVFIKPIHDVGVQLKFACQIFPAINPGETAVIGYSCKGGRFMDELYWRHTVFLPTEHIHLRIRLQGVDALSGCSAVEDRLDGSELTAMESLSLPNDGTGIVIDLNRRNLRSNQSVTVRWDVA
ncbi:hypothetical protein GCM10022223_20050 [Kineosporia mesophila]|uniref:Transcriptional regulator n=1 Tax=Kineosporia mesophila TaxID=566012 RepID=A0ABP6ZBN3_9ACTN|nr:hypothetical protein [Kineosporia mesophila]MCD5350104.1 hypothetical protein [Kineosporia mesophila]